MKPNVRKALFVFDTCAKRGYPRGTFSNDRKVKQTGMYGVWVTCNCLLLASPNRALIVARVSRVRDDSASIDPSVHSLLKLPPFFFVIFFLRPWRSSGSGSCRRLKIGTLDLVKGRPVAALRYAPMSNRFEGGVKQRFGEKEPTQKIHLYRRKGRAEVSK